VVVALALQNFLRTTLVLVCDAAWTRIKVRYRGCPRQKLTFRIIAPLSRQPLVKGERLIRFEVSAAMAILAVL